MRLKKPTRAIIDQVRITREGNDAIIDYADAGIAGTRLTIGPDIATMTDRDIIDVFNGILAAQERLLAAWDKTVTEEPPGEKQIDYHEDSDQWVSRGDVLRCIIDDSGPEGEVTIHIDDKELSLAEFGRMLRVHAGWGMRIAFVPEEFISENPRSKSESPSGESADAAKDEAMTREEALTLYHPIRASVRRILSAAISVCNQSDFMRAAKQLGPWVEGTIALPEGDQAADMLSDIALFEPNQRGRRAFDVFLASKARQLDAADFELAQRMGKAFFSLFRCTGRHGIAGVWLEDQLDRNRTLWLMDEGMEASAPTKSAFGMRLFDAGEFHVGFGIVVPSDEETTGFSIQGMTRNGRVPFRHSLAVTLYGDSLCGSMPLSPELEDTFTSSLAGLIDLRSDSRRVIGARPKSQEARKRKRR